MRTTVKSGRAATALVAAAAAALLIIVCGGQDTPGRQTSPGQSVSLGALGTEKPATGQAVAALERSVP
ncbi:hypothetical protein [Streptomyces griseorubiginosus]|uniref:hypothetical protein n=1 Tax=Streptomyces griseorubiginosus TaxID=67304 RepID=UPI0013C3FC27|nr:hypothetical protein [Streptomyces griseorubiginosus]